MTGWPRFRSVQRLKDSIARRRTEEVRDDNSVASKESQVLTDVASSLGFESALSSQEGMPSKDNSSRWERFTGMLERRMQRPQIDNELITVELRGSRSQPNTPVVNTSMSARSASPATVGSHKSAPSSSIRNGSNSSRCPSPATSVVSRKSVTFEPECLARLASQTSEKPRTSERRESPVDRRDDAVEQRTKFVMKEPARPSTASDQILTRGPSQESNLRYDSDKYKPVLSFDESSLASHPKNIDPRNNFDSSIIRRQSMSPTPLLTSRMGSKLADRSGSNATIQKKKPRETEYDDVQDQDIAIDDVSVISEITGLTTAFAPSPYRAAAAQRSTPTKGRQQKLKQSELKPAIKSNPTQGAVRKLDPILRNKNKKYPPTVNDQELRLALAPPAHYRESLRDTVAEGSGKLKKVSDDDSGDSDYLSFSQLLHRMASCSGRPGGLDDLLLSPSQSVDEEEDRDGEDEDNSYFALSTAGGSTQISTRSSSSTSTIGEDLLSMLLCGSGDVHSSKHRSIRHL